MIATYRIHRLSTATLDLSRDAGQQPEASDVYVGDTTDVFAWVRERIGSGDGAYRFTPSLPGTPAMRVRIASGRAWVSQGGGPEMEIREPQPEPAEES